MKNTFWCNKIVALLLLSFLPSTLIAHHSVDGTYDESKEIEIAGEITAIRWRNPHVSFSVAATNDAGVTEEWNIETSSLSTLRRRGVSQDFMAVGDSVRVFGIAARRDPTGMHARNLLLPNGAEFLLEDGGTPHWRGISKSTEGNPNLGRLGDSSSPELGIFRVWSLPTELGGGSLWNSSYPLTESARVSENAFDMLTDNITLNCQPKGMPTIMEQPYPISFEQQGENIILRIEEYDSVRTIHMDSASAATPQDLEPARMGYSVGQWEGETLVVTTTNIGWRHFNGRGIPLSEHAQIIERWTASEDGSRLDYSMTTIDPQTFTSPVELKRSRLWYPEAKVSPYQCDY
jgi:hypothetical protein